MVFLLFFFFSIFHFDYRNCLQCRQKILQSTTQNLRHRILTAVLIIVVPYNTSCYHTCVTLLLIALRYQLQNYNVTFRYFKYCTFCRTQVFFFSFSQFSYSSLKEQFLQSGQYNLRYNTYSNATNCVACRAGVIWRASAQYLLNKNGSGRQGRKRFVSSSRSLFLPSTLTPN